MSDLPVWAQIAIAFGLALGALVWYVGRQIGTVVSRTEPNKTVVDVFTPIQESINRLRTDMKESHDRLQNGVDGLSKDVKTLQISSAGFGARLESLEREVYRRSPKES